MSEKSQKLVDAHWDNYVGPLMQKMMELIEFTYKTSGVHFYGHGFEDSKKEREEA